MQTLSPKHHLPQTTHHENEKLVVSRVHPGLYRAAEVKAGRTMLPVRGRRAFGIGGRSRHY